MLVAQSHAFCFTPFLETPNYEKRNQLKNPFGNTRICNLQSGLVGLFAHRTEKENRMLRHVVLFKFKDTSSKEVFKSGDAFRSLKTSIPQVADFEFGTDNSPEGLANGIYIVSSSPLKVRLIETLSASPQATEFVEILKPHLDKVQVIDYWATK